MMSGVHEGHEVDFRRGSKRSAGEQVSRRRTVGGSYDDKRQRKSSGAHGGHQAGRRNSSGGEWGNHSGTADGESTISIREERDLLKNRVNQLEVQISEMSNTRYGRSGLNTNKSKWRVCDLANMNNLSKWLKMKLFPNYKFLIGSWWKWTPEIEKSLCVRLQRSCVKFPSECGHQWYWEEKVVSMVNKKYVEMRSNINGACRKVYMQSKLQCGGEFV